MRLPTLVEWVAASFSNSSVASCITQQRGGRVQQHLVHCALTFLSISSTASMPAAMKISMRTGWTPSCFSRRHTRSVLARIVTYIYVKYNQYGISVRN